MTAEDPFIFSLALDGRGGAAPVDPTAALAGASRGQPVWLHLHLDHPRTRDWLAGHTGLDTVILDALLAPETRPRIVEHGKSSLLILRGINLNENAAPEDMVSLRLYVDDSCVISVRRRRLHAVTDTQGILIEGRGPCSTGDIVSYLVTRLCGRMEPLLTGFDDQLSEMEISTLENPDPAHRQGIAGLRHQAAQFRRFLAPQREALARLRLIDAPWLSDDNRRQLLESHDRTSRLVEDMDNLRERGQIIQDELSHMLADRTNGILYILSIISAIFLPLTFITGVLGMNIGGVPGVDRPEAFGIFTFLTLLIALIQMAIFRRLRWF